MTKYYIPANTHFEVWYFIMNEKLFNKLSDDSKQALMEVAGEFESRRWKVVEADQKANEQRLADFGAKIVPITNAQIAAIAAKIQATVWPEVLKDVGEDWGKSVLNQIIE